MHLNACSCPHCYPRSPSIPAASHFEAVPAAGTCSAWATRRIHSRNKARLRGVCAVTPLSYCLHHCCPVLNICPAQPMLSILWHSYLFQPSECCQYQLAQQNGHHKLLQHHRSIVPVPAPGRQQRCCGCAFEAICTAVPVQLALEVQSEALIYKGLLQATCCKLREAFLLDVAVSTVCKHDRTCS